MPPPCCHHSNRALGLSGELVHPSAEISSCVQENIGPPSVSKHMIGPAFLMSSPRPQDDAVCGSIDGRPAMNSG